MARVKLLVKTRGARSGDVIDVDPDVAKSLIANHLAVAVKAEPKKSVKD